MIFNTNVIDKIRGISGGGTGADNASDAIDNLLENKALPISKGGTGAKSKRYARANLEIQDVLACSAKSSVSSLSLSASAITQVSLDNFSVKSDNDTAFSISDGAIKCDYAGLIVVIGGVYINNTSSGMNTGIYIKKNGTEVLSAWGLQNTTATVAGLLSVSAGDVISLNARASSATTAVPNNYSTHLDIMYLESNSNSAQITEV